jgi:hypothetical protein
MELTSVDKVAVLIAAVLNMAINYVWYSKWAFGPFWMKLAGVRESDVKDAKLAMLYGFIASVVTAFFLAWFIGTLNVTTVSDGMFVAFFAWLGFVATTQISGVIWGKKPFQLFLITTGARLLSFLVMGGFLGA